jgi:arylsulfatase A-like enzyme
LRAALVPSLLAVALAACAGCRPPVQGRGWNVLLVTIETTRADHLSTYGYARETSPAITAFAASGVLFERAGVAIPRTNPSLASLMTSRYPHEHGVRNLLLPLEPENRTLAEVLRAAGYATGAVQTHPRLIAASGFAQGFDAYLDAFTEHPLAEQACARAEAWIDGRGSGGRPWFLWLHLMDPHWTYDPPAAWRTFAGPDPRPARLYADLAARRRTIGPVIFRNAMPADEVAAFVDLYDSEIRYTDHAIGGLLAALDRRGLRDGTIVVLTADHGESLGENGYFFEHGDLGSEAEVHVPLVVRAPGLPAGVRVGATVGQLDVAPTVLDLLDLAGDGSFRGTSLLPLLEGPGADRPLFGETDQAFHEENPRREIPGLAGKWRWLRQGRFKLVAIPRAAGGELRRLYDLDGPGGESVDVSAEHPDVLRRMGEALDAWRSEDQGRDREYHISDEAEEILRSLGYVN